MRIKETRQRYNRGSEWCLAESSLGRWYLQLTEEYTSSSSSSASASPKDACTEFSRLVQLSTLIPELTSSMVPHSPEKPVLLNLDTCPDYLLGLVPHPELFVINNRKTPSPPSTMMHVVSEFPVNNPFPLSSDEFCLGSPLSRKATPKHFDFDMDIATEYLDFN